MRFERESWRKLYVNESIQHRLMPVLSRGLRDYIIRLASDDGTLLSKTENPSADLARAMGTHPDEIALVISYLDLWLSDGYLKHSRGRLSIAKFEEAQSARSPGAVRQARYRKGKTDDDDDVTSDVTGDATVTSPGDAHVTSQKTRRDETRSEEIRTVFGVWQRVTDHPNAILDAKRSKRINARLAEGFTVAQLIQALENWRLDPWLAGKNDSGRVYDGIETLLRDAAQVERLMALGSGNAGVIEIK